jgi:hypothetical protein
LAGFNKYNSVLKTVVTHFVNKGEIKQTRHSALEISEEELIHKTHGTE